ncbi:Holliday junction branch migration protein RuvA [Nostocoides sp. F2B08]|uniref:Holliday junction branch migration protein RuvA n=1 Tax=Nostocoides sp. F2B08 TaxID=2653936 RepID=UPI001263D75E|nr:Holliday junction branch migration protein RuvA [Tetrasphaera sp. F2B08]KAB7743059.1 Holliday junction branch migration protein RuvA [Tetrasphaera sp. F2B08]
MIASLAGVVEHAALDRVVLGVGGVGLLVHTTPATAAASRTGSQLLLATTLVVREDALTLYGFGSVDERDMFETVQSVSGVGPRIALAMLSVMGPDDLRKALSEGDTKALTRVPGIGAKSAERLVLELRDKVGHAAPGTGSAPTDAARGGGDDWRAQVTEALTGLGYSAKQAGDTVSAVAREHPDERDVSTLLRLALRGLRT